MFMNDEIAYIEAMETAELVDIISNIWGFEETSKALLTLLERDPQRALGLGIDILEKDKGDDYLQATAWDVVFDISPIEVLESLSKRNTNCGKVLLYDILKELNSGFHIKNMSELSEKVVSKIKESFDSLLEKERISLENEFYEFTSKTK